MVWDIWNEPDVPYFWTGTEAQYHELYRRAYVAIRQELGTRATVAGPSVSAFRWGWLVGLLEYCRGADCAVDALSWHELPGGRGIAAVADHLRRARAGLLRNPAYAALGVRGLYIGEYVGEGDALWPGEMLGLPLPARARRRERGRPCLLARPFRGGHLHGPHARRASRRCHHAPAGAVVGAALVRAWHRLAGAQPIGRPGARGHGGAPPGGSDWRHAEIVLGYLDTHDRPLPPRTDVLIDVRGLSNLKFMRGAAVPHVTAYRVRSHGEAPATPLACGRRTSSARRARKAGPACPRPAPPRRPAVAPLRAAAPWRRRATGARR